MEGALYEGKGSWEMEVEAAGLSSVVTPSANTSVAAHETQKRVEEKGGRGSRGSGDRGWQG